MTSPHRVTLGTRGSKLALVQAEYCADKLRAQNIEVEVRVIKTTSEHHPNVPLSVIDQRDVFTRQLDEGLLSGEIDLAVHSLKDIPTELPNGISITAVPTRHDSSDALVSSKGYDIEDLPEGAVVATSSIRRQAQLLHHRHDLKTVEIRGNIDTRIRKMYEGQSDALVLAYAGLSRLCLDVPHTVISWDEMLPAVGQGALAVATLEGHHLNQEIRAALNHEPTEKAILAERAMLRALEGGCRVPVGGQATGKDGKIHLRGLVASPDGALMYKAAGEGEDPESLGEKLARELLDQGAAVILDEVREVRS